MGITMDLLDRGQERYNIYCSPCHDYLGTGEGMVIRRGFRRLAPSFNTAQLRSRPARHFYEAIVNGFGVMPSYAQIPAADRWAIIAYIRALQLSQWASIDDVPADVLPKLKAGIR